MRTYVIAGFVIPAPCYWDWYRSGIGKDDPDVHGEIPKTSSMDIDAATLGDFIKKSRLGELKARLEDPPSWLFVPKGVWPKSSKSRPLPSTVSQAALVQNPESPTGVVGDDVRRYIFIPTSGGIFSNKVAPARCRIRRDDTDPWVVAVREFIENEMGLDFVENDVHWYNERLN